MMGRRPALRIALDVLIAVVAGAFDIAIYLGRSEDAGLRTGGFAEPVSVGLLAVGALALIVRRRYPTAVFVVVWCVAFCSVIAPDLQPVAILSVGLYSIAVRRSRAVAVMALGAALGAYGVMAVNTAPVGRSSLGAWVLVTLTAYVVLPSAVWAVGRWRHRAIIREEQLRAEGDRRLERALRDERLRLSRELHDIVSHTVSVMTMQASGARALVDIEPERVGPALEVIERAGGQAMNELQRMLEVLRAESPHPAPDLLPPASIEELIDLARSSGQQVELEVSGSRSDLDPSVELACYRVIQESLTNARKYAGSSARVVIQMEWVPPTLAVTVLNEPGDVSGQQVLSTGNGLAGLAERVQLIGGRLTTDPLPDGGFRVNAVLPVPPPGADQDHK